MVTPAFRDHLLKLCCKISPLFISSPGDIVTLQKWFLAYLWGVSFFSTAFHLVPYLTLSSEWSSPNFLSSGEGAKYGKAQWVLPICLKLPRALEHYKLQNCLLGESGILLHSFTSLTLTTTDVLVCHIWNSFTAFWWDARTHITSLFFPVGKFWI